MGIFRHPRLLRLALLALPVAALLGLSATAAQARDHHHYSHHHHHWHHHH